MTKEQIIHAMRKYEPDMEIHIGLAFDGKIHMTATIESIQTIACRPMLIVPTSSIVGATHPQPIQVVE
jgi:hypothetical protein